jgi:UDP-glucose 4,6-dehydratase
VVQGGVERVERDLNKPDVRSLLTVKPQLFHGFTESDEPNFSFRRPPCSFYAGSKALAEEAIKAAGGRAYVWRLRIPFDEHDNARNFLSKIQRYPKVYDNVNSISHRGDFVRACLDLWGRRAPFGIYNVTNPGFITTRHVVESVQNILKPDRQFEFWTDDLEFYRHGAKTPRSNCILDVSKLLAMGVKMRPVEEALVEALTHWQPEAR